MSDVSWIFGHAVEFSDQPAWLEIFCDGELVKAISVDVGTFRCSGCGKELRLVW